MIRLKPDPIPHHGEEGQAVGGHDRSEENVQLVGVHPPLRQSIDRHAKNSKEPHGQDTPAEMRNFRPLEWVQEAQEEERCHYDGSKVFVEVLKLLE